MYHTKHWTSPHEMNPSKLYNEHLPYKANGFFVEIGVGGSLPPNASNTADLADLGWSGLYFEPHPTYHAEAVKRHESNSERVKVVNVGIGDVNETKVILPGDTFLEDVNAHYDRLGWLDYCNVHGNQYKEKYGAPECEIKNVMQALEENDCPMRYDLLSIDVEGYEQRIVNAYNFNKFRPTIVILELRNNNPSSFNANTETGKNLVQQGISVTNQMIANGYTVIHSDVANTWFKDTTVTTVLQ